MHESPDKRRIFPSLNVRNTGGSFFAALRRAPNTFAEVKRGEPDHPATRKREKKPHFTKGRNGISERKIRIHKKQIVGLQTQCRDAYKVVFKKTLYLCPTPYGPSQKAGPIYSDRKTAQRMNEYKIEWEEILRYETQLDKMQEELDELYGMLTALKTKEGKGDPKDACKGLPPEMIRKAGRVSAFLSGKERD